MNLDHTGITGGGQDVGSEWGLGVGEMPCEGQRSRGGFGRAGAAKRAGPGDLQRAGLPTPRSPIPGKRTGVRGLLHGAEEPDDIGNPLNKH